MNNKIRISDHFSNPVVELPVGVADQDTIDGRGRREIDECGPDERLRGHRGLAPAKARSQYSERLSAGSIGQREDAAALRALRKKTHSVVHTLEEGDRMKQLSAIGLFLCLVSCATAPPKPTPTLKRPLACFFDGQVCAFDDGETWSIVGAVGADAFWLTTTPLKGIEPAAAARLQRRKGAEDAALYVAPGHPFRTTVVDTFDSDVRAFLRAEAKTLGYAGSLWQRLSAVGGWARTAGAVPPKVWLAVDPLIGSAGNGPDIVLAGVPFVGGDVAGSLTASIAIAHDVDWSLGRYLGSGPLAPYLFARRFGGRAPDQYSSSLGLAGLGEVECEPGQVLSEQTMPCDWYQFSKTASGGDYAQFFRSHPDWDVRRATVKHERRRRVVCLDDACVALPLEVSPNVGKDER